MKILASLSYVNKGKGRSAMELCHPGGRNREREETLQLTEHLPCISLYIYYFIQSLYKIGGVVPPDPVLHIGNLTL